MEQTHFSNKPSQFYGNYGDDRQLLELGENNNNFSSLDLVNLTSQEIEIIS